MLSPEYMAKAGDLVGAAYGEIEAQLLEYLCRLLLDQGVAVVGQRGLTAISLLAQTHAAQLLAIVNAHRGEVSRAVLAEVADALGVSDATDTRALGRAAREAAAKSRPRQAELTARGIAAVLERDNVEMTAGALDLWNRVVAEAATKVNTGSVTAERAIHEAVRRMMREGITTVQYRNAATGRQTVRNAVDVAVRRHVRTQLAQDGARRTMDICREAGVRLVEVSSHSGARPSHAKWQGRVFSLDGDVTVGGVRYRDFYRETGYGSVDGLMGANCRHSFGPWVPGTPRMYSPDPEHPSGLTGDEVYRLEQGQRRRERAIRQTKRELKGAQLIADGDASLANIAEVERIKGRLRDQQAEMRAYIKEANGRGKGDVLQRSPNREWAGDMPKVRKTTASGRSLKEFMAQDSVAKTLKDKRLSKTKVEATLKATLQTDGLRSGSFRLLSASQQRAYLKGAMEYEEVAAKTKAAEKARDLRVADTAANVISPQKQARHTIGTREYQAYVEQRAKDGHSAPSATVLSNEELGELVARFAGTGDVKLSRNGEWSGQEFCDTDRVVGYYYDRDGAAHETRRAQFIYANKSVHVVPSREKPNG